MQKPSKSSHIRQLLSDLETSCLSQGNPPLEHFKHMMDLYAQEQSILSEQARNHETLPVTKQRFPPLFSL